jgi:ATP-binding protein involved in chromosome partitioning
MYHTAFPPASSSRYLTRVSDDDLKIRVEYALRGVKHPRTGADVLTLGLVKDLTVDAAGGVDYTFQLGKDDPGSLARETRKAVQGIAGVSAVRARVQEASTGARPRTGTPGGAPVPPAPTPDELPGLGKALAISSGKGGVGKSTVSANLAVALAARGHRVGLMDADIYGPNVPRMMGVFDKPEVQDGRINRSQPGVKLISLGNIVGRTPPPSGADRSS